MNEDQPSTETTTPPVVEQAAAPAPVSGAATPAGAPAAPVSDRRQVNKIVYVLLTFFLGTLGVHRFMRGQIGIGILMLLVSWATFGIWQLIDFIISLVKLGEYPGEDFIFTADGRWAK